MPQPSPSGWVGPTLLQVGARFADYRPDQSGTQRLVDVLVMTPAHIEECAALAIARDGGGPVAWIASFERNLTAHDRVTFVGLLGHRVVGYGTAGWFAPHTIGSGSTIPNGWYLLGLVVDPQVRRHGIGRQLTIARLGWLQQRTPQVW